LSLRKLLEKREQENNPPKSSNDEPEKAEDSRVDDASSHDRAGDGNGIATRQTIVKPVKPRAKKPVKPIVKPVKQPGETPQAAPDALPVKQYLTAKALGDAIARSHFHMDGEGLFKDWITRTYRKKGRGTKLKGAMRTIVLDYLIEIFRQLKSEGYE